MLTSASGISVYDGAIAILSDIANERENKLNINLYLDQSGGHGIASNIQIKVYYHHHRHTREKHVPAYRIRSHFPLLFKPAANDVRSHTHTRAREHAGARSRPARTYHLSSLVVLCCMPADICVCGCGAFSINDFRVRRRRI